MKGFLSICAGLMLLLGGAGLASADLYDLTTSNSHELITDGQYSPTYNINYATKLVEGAYTSTGTLWTTGDEFSSYVAAQVKQPQSYPVPPIGAWVLGSPDFNYGADLNPYGYEMTGGAAGMSPNSPYTSTSWFVVGFDQPVANVAGNDLVVTRVGGWKSGTAMEVYVSTDTTYGSSMTWYDLGALTSPGSKPSGNYGAAPAQYFDLSSAGITGDVNYVKFVGNGYWIDSVGSPVPIPGAVYLLGSGLLGLCGLRKRHFKKV